MKSINNFIKPDKDEFIIPKGVQDTIPIKRIWEDGIFLIGRNRYSKTFIFSDINFDVASEDDKKEMAFDYMQILNSFEDETFIKITIMNSKINEVEIENNVKVENEHDRLDKFRKEYNRLIDESSKSSNGIKQDKYITVTVTKKNIEDARITIRRIALELNKHFKKLNSSCVELDTNERLKLFHNFYRQGEENTFFFDMQDCMQKGHSFKDYICSDSVEFRWNYFKVGKKFGRVLFIKEYASFIKDNLISELTDISKNLILSIDIKPVQANDALKEAESRLLGIETNIKW